MEIARLARKPTGSVREPVFGLLVLAASCQLLAQSSSGPSMPPAPPPVSTGVGVTLKPVDVIGVAADDTESRRLSTAAKIIVGRDDIERYGDSTVGELLKRLPGITVQGRPGRGGAPRMRGLGGGYTQILVDGERVPRGFSLDDLAPDQIERIEILRAPTAETGARAIAGSINIITRGGYNKRVNSVNVGAGMENGHTQPGASWSRNDKVDGLIYNFSVSAMRAERSNDVSTSTLTENLDSGEVIHQSENSSSPGWRAGIHANGRLQWRSDSGDSFTLTPMFVATHNSGTVNRQLFQSDGKAPYDSSSGSSDNRFSTVRLAGKWIHQLDDGASLY